MTLQGLNSRCYDVEWRGVRACCVRALCALLELICVFFVLCPFVFSVCCVCVLCVFFVTLCVCLV